MASNGNERGVKEGAKSGVGAVDFKTTATVDGEARRHRLELADRRRLTVCGVKLVESFNATEIKMKTVCGGLTVVGGNLAVDALEVEGGTAQISGRIDALRYSRDKENVLKRLFK